MTTTKMTDTIEDIAAMRYNDLVDLTEDGYGWKQSQKRNPYWEQKIARLNDIKNKYRELSWGAY